MIFSNFENNYLPIQHIFIADYQRAKGFPCGSAGKESAYNAEDLGSIPGSRRSPGEGYGNPLVLLPGESQGWRSLFGYCPWGHKESETTE